MFDRRSHAPRRGVGAFRGMQPNKRSGGSGTAPGRQRKDVRYSVIALLSLKLYASFARSFGGYLTSGSVPSRLCSFCVPHGSRSTTASMIQYIVQYQVMPHARTELFKLPAGTGCLAGFVPGPGRVQKKVADLLLQRCNFVPTQPSTLRPRFRDGSSCSAIDGTLYTDKFGTRGTRRSLRTPRAGNWRSREIALGPLLGGPPAFLSLPTTLSRP